MKFADVPTMKPAEAEKMVSENKLNPVFVSAKGLNGIRLPLLAIRQEVLSLCPENPVFVPVTDKWNSVDDVLAKDLALQLRNDSGSKMPVILSATADRYERLADLDLANGFKDSAAVVVHPTPSDKDIESMRAWHKRSKEIIGDEKPLRLFADHILTVELFAPKSKSKGVFVDGGGGFMIFDQVHKYLVEKRVSRAIAINVTLAGKDSEIRPYMFDNFGDLGEFTENEKGTIRMIDAPKVVKTLPKLS